MTKEEKDTEELIFDAACRVFQRKGYDGARMQEIADEADINKSMLHYYYRSKDKLFQKVYQREMSRFFPVIFGVLDSDMPIDEKVEQLIETYYTFLDKNPKIVQFLFHEMNKNPERLKEFIDKQGIHPPKKLMRQLNEEAQEGKMDKVKPKQFLTSIVGLILFPFYSQAMIRGIFDLNEDEFAEYLKERKDFLLNFILNGINYKRQ
ncbi:TetR/AcrR family transcriptional regulator [Fodinibius halophilus]|uniref:TetR/AcrR family transcriptional regulator n=1 Tax=Fodinibius halophilus TaxID=1736908 RepID=A0A6M1T9U9_9BACT|nr:TetR/AcrR family transcriptional regulator [Fodinibius halophilus]NGP89293.1 TetR/AcrR family transcriptional regulator [Fodinibius halophilus]